MKTCLTCNNKNIRARNLCPTHYEQWRQSNPNLVKKFYNIKIGDTFGRLTIINRVDQKGKRLFKCICSCGAYKNIYGSYLIAGDTKSCGCLLKETQEAHIKSWKKHGLSDIPEYGAWKNAISRCYKITDQNYRHYGGRGIKVCNEWLDNFEVFLRDMGYRPSPQHSLDRINNDGDYSPTNCRWATIVEQGNNRRRYTVPAIRLQELLDKEILLTKYINKFGSLYD